MKHATSKLACLATLIAAIPGRHFLRAKREVTIFTSAAPSRPLTLIPSVIAMALVYVLSGSSNALADDDTGAKREPVCSKATLKGAYGIQMHGTVALGPPPAPTQSVIGVVVRVYDGKGGFTQFDNIKGSITGIAPQPRPGAGVYVVNEDCTGTTQFDPGSGVTLVERLVIVDEGREYFAITADPLSVMVTALGKKIR